MPHKHIRKGGNDSQEFNLAPSELARPLSAFGSKTGGTGRKRKRNAKPDSRAVKKQKPVIEHYGLDDTPRAFSRMLQAQSNRRKTSAQDDGDRHRSKKIETKDSRRGVRDLQEQHLSITNETLQRLPGESLRDFSVRVDQALPIGGLASKRKKIAGIQDRQTKTEKRLHKMYSEWRAEEARIKAREEELAERAEEEEESKISELASQDIRLPLSKRAKKRRVIGEVGGAEDDPWAVLETRRIAPKGLHDVVQAPPEFTATPKEKFHVRNGAKISVANVPHAAGSLRKREELGAARMEVIQRYRAMMRSDNR